MSNRAVLTAAGDFVLPDGSPDNAAIEAVLDRGQEVIKYELYENLC